MVTIDLVVMNDSHTNKYISFLRKKTSKSISEIKKEITLSDPVIKYNYFDEEELTSLVTTAEELLLLGATIKLYENEREITLQMVKNLIESFKGIARDRERIDDLLLDDEEK